MNATFWLVLAIVCFVLAGIFLILAAVIFFRMKIPSVIDDLTGKTVVREVRSIKEKNHQQRAFSAVDSAPPIKNAGNITETLDFDTNHHQNHSVKSYQATADLSYHDSSERAKASVETMVLNYPVIEEEKNQAEFFEIVRKIVVIHTQEIIV